MLHKGLRLKVWAKMAVGYPFWNRSWNPRIRHDLKAVFIHIPKTAGNSITKALNKIPKDHQKTTTRVPKHARALELKLVLGQETWDEYFSFALVRNPWELMVSSYNWWLQKASNIPYHRRHHKNVSEMDNFEEFLWSKYGQKMINERYGQIRDWLADNGDIIVDFIGKVETIEDDWKLICEKIGVEPPDLGWYNRTTRKPYQDYYNNKSREFIAERFEWVIDEFGYTFE